MTKNAICAYTVESHDVSTPRPLKLCFLGNINNMPLIYARAMRDMGIDVTMYFDAKTNETLHRPESRYPEYHILPYWLHPLPIRKRAAYFFLSRVLASRLVRTLKAQRFDGFVLNGLFVSLAPLLPGIKFALLAGSDLDVYCNERSFEWKPMVDEFGPFMGTIRHLVFHSLVRQQRKGLVHCSGLNFFPPGINPKGDQLLDEVLFGLPIHRIPIRGVETKFLDYEECSNRTGNDVEILLPARFVWKEPLPPGYSAIENKRNDLMIEGIAKLFHCTGLRPKVFMVEKGPHVSESKKLIEQLGIENQVTWLPEMTHTALIQWYRRVDIVFDQLGDHMIGGIALDAMLLGRPVIANARPEVFDPLFGQPTTVCHASTSSEVAEQLQRLVTDPKYRRMIGVQSRDYVSAHFNGHETARQMTNFFRMFPSNAHSPI